MAFMMPVMKNNYEIYKDTRSRKTSECSNASSSGNGNTTVASAMGTPGATQQRRRKVSECKSESFATSPSHGQLGAHRMQMQRCQSSRAFPRNASRSSHTSMMSPTRSYAAGVGNTSGNSPPTRSQTASALERQATASASASAQQKQNNAANGGEGNGSGSGSGSYDYTKFHVRLVDKLRKSFRKDSGKRS